MLARQLGDRSREVHAGPVAQGRHRQLRGARQDAGHRRLRAHRLAARRARRVARHARPLLRHRHDEAADGQQPLACHARRAAREASDFVTLHVPATPQTEKMIGAAELARMKKGAYLLNASRGTVVDIPALADALKIGPPRRGGGRRLPRGAGDQQRRLRHRAAGPAQRDPHAAHRRLDRGGAGGHRPRGGHLAHQVRQQRGHHRRGELPAGRAAADCRARTASSTCTATCPACCATSTGSSRT